jgi:hypothetical protein
MAPNFTAEKCFKKSYSEDTLLYTALIYHIRHIGFWANHPEVSIVHGTDSKAHWHFRVHLALFTEKATSESTCCYPWMCFGFHTVGWGHFASKWCWSITFLQSYKCCRKARSSSPGKKFVHLIAAALPCHHWLLVWSKIYHMDPIFTPRHMFISIKLTSFAWDFVKPLLLNSIHMTTIVH